MGRRQTPGHRGGRCPSLGPQGLLEALGPLDQRVRILELFHFLPAIRICNDKFVIVTIRLAADFVEEPRVLALEEPNH